MMRRLLHPLVSSLVVVASAVPLFAGDQLFDFESDPTGVPGFILYGNRAPSAYQFFDGNPGGYLQLTEAVGGQTAGIVFPDVDLFTNSLGQVVSLPVKAIRFEMDVRAGNGSRRPADGFSISFCRQNDPALFWANQAQFRGWAGGDGCAQANQGLDPNGATSGTAENGTKTGLAIAFDSWAGNELPNTVASTTCADNNDVEGLAVRLDDRTLIQVPLANRNGNCFITELNPGDACLALAQADTNSLQTGPWTGPSVNTGDGGQSDGTYNNLSWQRFTAEVDADKRVTVTWKGRIILNQYQLTNYPTSQGRLILGARTGGNYQHTHMDNVRVITTPAYQPVFQSLTGTTNGFRINILNISSAQVTNFPSVTLDGVNVTSQVVVSNYLDITTHGTYTQAVRFAARSTHTVVTVFRDALGQQFTNTSNFTVPQYLDLVNPIPLAQMDTTKPGFKIKSYQSLRFEPNQLRWTEEKVIGIRGPNVANQASAVGGFFSWPGIPHFSNGGGGNLFPGTAVPFTTFGIGDSQPPTPSNADNSALELFGYLYFPAAGIYTMYAGSDDGYRLSFAANPQDRMGAVANEFDGGRGLGEPGDQFTLNVTAPGCYPMRLLWENGGGGADLQWLTGVDTTYSLVNDTGDAASILAYADVLPTASLGAYVKKANPVRDAQNVVFYQPILVELGNGTGTRTVNQSTIVLAVDGTNQNLTFTSPEAGTTRIVSQMGGNVWTVGRHTNTLTFADNAGTNYTYSWPFTVINVQPTNTISIPLANMVPAASVDATQPGFRVKSWQSPHDNPNHLSWTEMQLQGLKGPNVANQTGTNGPGYFSFAQANGGGEGDGILDLRNNNGGNGEWGYQQALEGAPGNPGLFGIGDNTAWTTTGLNAYRFNFPDNDSESCALDIGFWLVFPAPGTYILHVNSDDNGKMLAVVGNPFNKLGIVLTESSGGRGVGGASGAMVGGDYRAITVPAAGAYPFRIVYENGGGGGGIEFSVYQFLPDGGVAKVPVNSYADANSIRAYQTLTAGDTVAPYVSFANPPHNHQETAYWQPIVVELTDGPGAKVVNAASIELFVDGVSRPVTISLPSAGIKRIVQDSPNWLPVPGAHTNVLTYADNGGTRYTNTWPFTVMNLTPYVNNQPGVVVDVPASSAVPINTVNHNQPGFRVYSYQSGTAGVGNVEEAERLFLGERGVNITDQSGTNGPGFFIHNDVVDFADGYNHNPGFSGYDTDSANGAYRYNYPFSRFGIQPKGGGVNSNDCALIFAGYMEFPKAGVYAMTFNSDDGFKITVPVGNPRSQPGSILGWFNAGRGNTTGTAFGPNGNVTHFVFNIPAPGAYPIRGLWWNGGGGLNIEWTIYQFLPDGSVARTIVGDTNTPGAIKVYQDSSLSGPYVISMNPGLPYNLVGDGLQVMTLGRGQNMIINLQDGNTTLDASKVSFTVNGIAQPLVITQPGGGVSTVTRFGTNALPSGFYGPAVFTYVDSANRTNTLTWTVRSSDFYGTLLGGYPLGSGDAAKPGFLWRTFQIDGAGTATMPTKIQVAEQALAGIWTNNLANLTSNTVNGYFVIAGTGADGTNGLINFNQDAPTATGDFFAANGHTDRRIPGVPGFGAAARNTDSIAGEAVAYVEFPTNGTYILGVNSDDGFRLNRGWGAANNNGALVVNSPASLAGVKAAVMSSMASRFQTNAISGQIVQALGVGNGSTIAAEACAITNGALLNGKIALIYRGTCGFAAKVQNAVAAGAIAVVIVQDRPITTPAEGWFPTELGITPIQDIPAIMIKRSDGDAIVQALSNNTAVVNVTLTPMDHLVNPPANSPVLGQADIGRGAAVNGGTLFNVTVPTAGVYPLRLLWMEGGGGASVEWFSVDSTTGGRVLLNDASSTNGPALKAFYGLTISPTVSLQVSGGTGTINYTGTLQMAPTVTGPWTDVYGQPPLVMPISQAAMQYFRSR